MKVILVFLLMLLAGCGFDDNLFVIEHQHWRVSVGAVTRQWRESAERECTENHGESVELRKTWRNKRYYCVYRDPIDTPRVVMTSTGWDRLVEWPFVPLRQGEIKVAVAECWVSYHHHRSADVHFLTVPCWDFLRYQRGTVWTGSSEATEASQLTEVR